MLPGTLFLGPQGVWGPNYKVLGIIGIHKSTPQNCGGQGIRDSGDVVVGFSTSRDTSTVETLNRVSGRQSSDCAIVK